MRTKAITNTGLTHMDSNAGGGGGIGSGSGTWALDNTWRTLFKDLGLSSADVLHHAGLPTHLLEQPHRRLHTPDFYRLWNSLQTLLNDPLLPLRVCQTLRSESFAPALFAALCSPHFLAAVQRIAHYKTLVAPIRLLLHEDAQHLHLELRWPDTEPAPPQSLVITELLFFTHLLRTGTREPLGPVYACTTAPPGTAAEQAAYSAFLGIPLESGPGHRLRFTRDHALRPFLTANPGLWTTFEPELRTRLADLQAGHRMGQRVRAVLLEALPAGQTGMDTIARTLAVSKRTLQRQLQAEGSSYHQLLQTTRLSLARHYLQSSQLGTPDIAFLLGYEETGSFWRALKKWTGQTPEQLRNPARAGTGRGRYIAPGESAQNAKP